MTLLYPYYLGNLYSKLLGEQKKHMRIFRGLFTENNIFIQDQQRYQSVFGTFVALIWNQFALSCNKNGLTRGYMLLLEGILLEGIWLVPPI